MRMFARKRLAQLLRNPNATRMLGDVEVQDAPAIMSDHEEAIQHAEAERGNSEEVHRRNHFAMITRECFPLFASIALFRNTPYPARDCLLRHVESEFQEFAVNARCTPGRVLRCHLKNEFTNVSADAGAADFATRTPAPVCSEALAVPPHHSVTCDNQKRFLPSSSHALQHLPKQLVESIKLGSLLALLEHCHLLTKD